jgi:quercetin dioxygenase-like cupin family protein
MRALIFLIPATLLAQRPVPVNNEWARVVIATTSPGPKGRMHEHSMNRVMIYLDKGAQTIEYQDGRSRVIAAQPGEVFWDPKGGLHTSQNTGGTTFRIIEIELKKDGGPARYPSNDPVSVAPRNYKVEMENEQVRILRVRLGAREKVAEHVHALPLLVAPLTELDLTGGEAPVRGKPGDAIFLPPQRRREENALDQPVEYLLVEFKG